MRQTLICLLVLSGCATAVRRESHLSPTFRARTLVVYPIGFRWEEPPDKGIWLAQRMVQRALEEVGGRAALVGPSEFKRVRPDDDHVWAATDLVVRLRDEGLSPEETLVLRPWVERRAASSRQERLDAQGRRVAASVQEEVTWVAHWDVVAPQTGEHVLEVSAEKQVDPFARNPNDSDPHPEMTQLLESLLHDVLVQLGPQLSADRGEKPVRTFYLPPKSETAEGLDAELQQLARLQQVNPELPESQAAALASLPSGLYVREPGSGLLRGDVILRVNEQPASPQGLARARSTPGCGARVLRAGGEQILPCPP